MHPKKNHWKCHVSFEGEKENIDDIYRKKKFNFKKIYTESIVHFFIVIVFSPKKQLRVTLIQ